MLLRNTIAWYELVVAIRGAAGVFAIRRYVLQRVSGRKRGMPQRASTRHVMMQRQTNANRHAPIMLASRVCVRVRVCGACVVCVRVRA